MNSFNEINDLPLHCDAVLPSQFYGSRRGSEQAEAEKRLMCAVLKDAIRCSERNLRARSVGARRAFLEAEHWLFKERNGGPFCFEHVCEALGLSSDFVRRTVSRRNNVLIAGAPSTCRGDRL